MSCARIPGAAWLRLAFEYLRPPASRAQSRPRCAVAGLRRLGVKPPSLRLPRRATMTACQPPPNRRLTCSSSAGSTKTPWRRLISNCRRIGPAYSPGVSGIRKSATTRRASVLHSSFSERARMAWCGPTHSGGTSRVGPCRPQNKMAPTNGAISLLSCAGLRARRDVIRRHEAYMGTKAVSPRPRALSCRRGGGRPPQPVIAAVLASGDLDGVPAACCSTS